MNAVTAIMAIFAVLGAVDLIIGNRFGLGAEFRKGFMMLGELVLSMVGMIVLAPLFAQLLGAPLKALSELILIDPSAFIGSLLANDMGGAPLSLVIANDSEIGYFSGLIIGSMMGATVSFTLPFVMGATEKSQRKSILLGLLCGICTIPLGCFVAGLMAGVGILPLLLNLIPLLLLSVILAVGLLKLPNTSVKIFNVFGIAIRVIVIAGLIIGILEYLLGLDIVPYTASIEEGADVVFNIAVVMSGAFPLLYLVSKLVAKPMGALGKKTGLNEKSLLGFVSTLATSVTTFGMMKEMDDRGVILNSAFAISAAFTLADHLAFTLSFKADYLPYVIIGKLISGVLAVALAALISKKQTLRDEKVG
ncbi:MAG: ethanolamine utilization protein EutH [Clostridia bacterium]|nr:ethanolamine utilization protein EutH [Clostridia bacterium]